MRAKLIAAVVLLPCWPPLTAAPTPSPTQGSLYLKNLQLPAGAKIIAFEIRLAGGAFEGISGVPPGWRVAIDNDPGWSATLEAHAKPGAAALSETTMQKIGLQVVERGWADSKLATSGEYVFVSAQGSERRIPLDSYNFDFVERYARRRLY